jgi:hypothetical protein
MADFRVTRVSAKEPRSWSFKDSKTGAAIPMETYNVMVEGESEPVEVNRKPGDKPAVGEVLTGSLETTEYGKRFKKERKPFTPGSFQPKDEAAIKAMWSIGQAVTFVGFHPDEAMITDIEPLARDLFAMVDRVKTGEPSGFQKAAAVAEKIKAKNPIADLEEVGLPGSVEDEKVNLDDIPF